MHPSFLNLDVIIRKITRLFVLCVIIYRYSAAFLSVVMAENRKIGQVKRISEVSIEWEIPNFVSLPQEVNRFYESGLFQILDNTWYLRIYPNGRKEDSSEGCIGLALAVKGSAPLKYVTHTFFLKTSDGLKEKLFDQKMMFDIDFGGWGRNSGFPRLHLLNRKSDLLPSDTLTVICRLKYASDAAGIDKLQQDFEELLLRGEKRDITLIVKGREFAAHSNILEARSPVFAALVERETTTGVIEIEDIHPNTFRDFLQYLYSAKVESLTSEKALTLYTTADKYQVNELKAVCLEYMLANISMENFCDFLELSLRHHENELHEVATQFFIKNSLEIVMTPKWQIFLGENVVHGNELLIEAFRVKK